MKGKKMKKIIITLCLILFTSSAYAGSCPMMAKNIDAKIAEAKELRDAGMNAHKSGDHAKSEELLNKALAPMIQFFPILALLRMTAPIPIRLLSPIVHP